MLLLYKNAERNIFQYTDSEFVGHSLQLLLQNPDLLLGADRFLLLCSQLPLEAVGAQFQVTL